MAVEAKLSHTAAMILQAVNAGYIYGFSVMEMTGLPSGTVYPAMRRLERDGLIQSKWEQETIANAKKSGYFGYQLEAQLTLGEIETAAGDTAIGQSVLADVRKQAQQKGFRLIANKAIKASAKSASS